MFLDSYNGRSLWLAGPVRNADLVLFTDTARSVGYGTFFQGQSSAERWPAFWWEVGLLKNLVLLELFPIVLSVELWGKSLQNKKVCFNF